LSLCERNLRQQKKKKKKERKEKQIMRYEDLLAGTWRNQGKEKNSKPNGMVPATITSTLN
jgi:hypothetical protein